MPRRKECPGGWGTLPARSSRRQHRRRALAACRLAPRSQAGAAPGHPAAAPALADAPRRGGWRTGGSVCTGRDSHQETCTDQWENQFVRVFYPGRGQYLCCPRNFFSFQKCQESCTMLKHTNTNKTDQWEFIGVFIATSFSL